MRWARYEPHDTTLHALMNQLVSQNSTQMRNKSIAKPIR